MKVTAVRVHLLRGTERYGSTPDAVEATDQGDLLPLLEVSTDAGLSGWCDIETFGPAAVSVVQGESMSALGFRTIADLLVGRELDSIPDIWHEIFTGTAYFGRRGVAVHCLSALDCCLWSIMAQAEGQPLSALLGRRRRDRIDAYASTLFRATPRENARAAEHYVNQGFTGMKFGWGGFGVDASLDTDNLAAIRAVIGPDRTLMIDPGWYVEEAGRPRLRTLDQTRRMLSVLEPFDPYWVEDFVHPETPELYCTLKNEFGSLRFATGEQYATVWEMSSLIRSGGIDVVQPDLSRCGGLTVSTQLVELALESGVEIVTHSWLSDLLHGYSLHFLCTLPTARWVEFNVAQSQLSRGVVRTRLQLDADGCVAVPSTVGLGVEVNTDFVRARTT